MNLWHEMPVYEQLAFATMVMSFIIFSSVRLFNFPTMSEGKADLILCITLMLMVCCFFGGVMPTVDRLEAKDHQNCVESFMETYTEEQADLICKDMRNSR